MINNIFSTQETIRMVTMMKINQRTVFKIKESHTLRPHPKKMLFSQSSHSILMLLIISCIFFMVAWMSSFFDVSIFYGGPASFSEGDNAN